MLTERREILSLDDGNYRGFLQNPHIVLMMGIRGGGLCEAFKQQLEEAAGGFPQVSFGVAWMNHRDKIYRFRQDHPEIFEEYGWPPTTVFIKDGSLESSLMRYYSAKEIQDKISEVFNIKTQTLEGINSPVEESTRESIGIRDRVPYGVLASAIADVIGRLRRR